MNQSNIFKQLTNFTGPTTNKTITNSCLTLDFSSSFIPESAFTYFDRFNQELDIFDSFNSLLSAQAVNYSENKAVLHHKTRDFTDKGFFFEQATNLYKFIEQLNHNQIPNLTNITHVIQIGIGGSFLGPKSIYESVLNYFSSNNLKPDRTAQFISYLDPLEFKSKMTSISPKNTLFIIASKSGSTQETLSNYELLKHWWSNEHNLNEDELKKQCISLSCKNAEIDSAEIADYHFYIDSTIGGRYCSTSVIGTCILGLCFGIKTVSEFLQGAYNFDQNALNPNVNNNLSLASAWSSIWYRNCKNYSSKAIIAYSYALRAFPYHLQQLQCESNGKSVSIHNETLKYKTSPIILGSSGTHCQHSFFQLIHQSSDIIPIEFICISNSPLKEDPFSTAHLKLNTNLKGQINALKDGNPNQDDLNKHFSGNRPSITISLDSLSPCAIGELLSFYENRTIFEGFIWNINSFDQEGVQLGKHLTNQYLSCS